MTDKNSYSYIHIGLCLRLLASINTTDKKSFIVRELDFLKNNLKNLNFNASVSNLNTMFFKEMETSLKKLNDDDTIGIELQKTISHEMMVLERHVLSEGTIKKVHILPERRFNSNYLLEEQDKLFQNGIFEKLPELAQKDIVSSCKCLLFGESTASAFHILRATEGTLKSYYFHHIRQNRLSKPMWHGMLTKLKEKTRNKPSITLIESLDLIRVAYRNPTQHPNATYEIDTVQDLLGVCIDVINKMGKEL